MGRKTRKQKLAAEKHRITENFSQINVNSIQTSRASLPILKNTYSLPVTNQKLSKISERTNEVLSYSYVLSDLKRIFVLTVLAFCAQGVLWYLLK